MSGATSEDENEKRIIQVLVAEDHTLVAEGIEVMVSMVDDIDLVAVVDTGEAAVERAAKEEVDVVLMDVKLGSGKVNGIEATRRIKESNPDAKVLMLSMFTDPGTVAEAVKAGADGYLSKGASSDAVLQAIRDIAAGRAVLDPNVTEGVFGRIGGRERGALTDREMTVLQELSYGKSTREVAETIHVSDETVKTYLKQIFRKLGVRDRTEAVAEALRRGLVH
jgi:DNA-binding NarL/FixJ family response regulator